jgi:nucleotide-binding universal stress UspA family protein
MFETVVWATDGSDAADEALEVARQVATSAGSHSVVAVHCIEMMLAGKGGGILPLSVVEDDTKQKIDQQVAQLVAAGIPARLEVKHALSGDAAGAIAEVAREHKADVIVVGTRGRGPLVGALLGSVTQRLLHLAPCPVLAVPTDSH